MASIDMKYNYSFGAKNRYYGGGTPQGAFDIGLQAFVIDHLNKSRQTMVLGLSNERRKGEGIVRSRSRVDTGSMKRQVTGTGDFGTDILKISFGWETLAPYYAPFQEFGTRRGITPMMAVHAAYTTVLADVRAMVGA
jgi:hypothetical protein